MAIAEAGGPAGPGTNTSLPRPPHAGEGMLAIDWCEIPHLLQARRGAGGRVPHTWVRQRTIRQPDDLVPAASRTRRSGLPLVTGRPAPDHAATVEPAPPIPPAARRTTSCLHAPGVQARRLKQAHRQGRRQSASAAAPPGGGHGGGRVAFAMSATRVNHVSVHAPDLATSVAWYEDLFGARRIPTPNFGMPVQWVGLGHTQVHLFQRDTDAPSHHHFAFAVDDFPAVYRRAGDLGAYDHDAFGPHFFELPGDTAQLYLRDPGGNLVEVDAPALSELPEEILADRKRLADVRPQDDENLRARLYLDPAQSSAEPPVA